MILTKADPLAGLDDLTRQVASSGVKSVKKESSASLKEALKASQDLVATCVSTIFAQPDEKSVLWQHSAVVAQLSCRFPEAAQAFAKARMKKIEYDEVDEGGTTMTIERKRSRILRAATAFLLMAAMAASTIFCGCGRETEEEPAFSEEVQQGIEEIISDAMAAQGIPGVIVGVWTPGGVWVGARGTADTATGEAMNISHTVRIASNTKTYTATVVLQLVEEGRLSLEDVLSAYVPEIPNAERITVRQLLNMTGGIYSYSEDEEFGRIFEAEPLKVWTEDEILQIVLRHPPDFEPGTDWHYSDTNYYLLGMIIEQVTGNTVEKEIARRIMDRLGLEQTWFPTGPDMPGDYAHGYMPAAGGEGIIEMTRIDPSGPWTGGAMVSSLQDLRTYVTALAEGGLLTPAMQEQRLKTVQIPDNVIRYGLGIASLGGFLGHTGAINGYNSVIFHHPELDATVVVIANKSTNSSGEAAKIFIAIARLLFPKLFPQPV